MTDFKVQIREKEAAKCYKLLFYHSLILVALVFYLTHHIMSMKHPTLFVAPSQAAGRGVFSTEDLYKGDFIESCPVIVIPKKEVSLIHQTFLHDYYFIWKKGRCAIALGYGSLYNHSISPNADYQMDFINKTIDVFCTKDIKAGEEITVSYIEEDNQKNQLWFEVEQIN